MYQARGSYCPVSPRLLTRDRVIWHHRKNLQVFYFILLIFLFFIRPGPGPTWMLPAAMPETVLVVMGECLEPMFSISWR